MLELYKNIDHAKIPDVYLMLLMNVDTVFPDSILHILKY